MNAPLNAFHCQVRFRQPRLEDGQFIHALIQRSPPLDLNSCYAYLLHGWHFAETCIIAEREGKMVGYISGYIPPQQPDTLFIWQVVTDASVRGTGLAQTLMAGLLARPACKAVRFIETTVSPSNAASRRCFEKLAAKLQCPLQVHEHIGTHHFPNPAAHEAEDLLRIGPFPTHNTSP